jgi:hypothetical protein
MQESASTPAPSLHPARKRILWAVLIAFLAASILTVTVVLPAEFGIDPTGIGRLSGLTGMSPSQPVAVASFYVDEFRSDTIDIPLKSYEELEYKVDMKAGGTLIFSWSVIEKLPLYVDFHGETTTAPEVHVQSYKIEEKAPSSNGALTAPFTGIHGWFWQNNNKTAVIVRLRTSGFYRLLDTPPKSDK